MFNLAHGFSQARRVLALLSILSFCASAVAQSSLMLRFERGSAAEVRVNHLIDSLQADKARKQRDAGFGASPGFGASRDDQSKRPSYYELKVPPAGQRMVQLYSKTPIRIDKSLLGLYAILDGSQKLEQRSGLPNDPGLTQQWQLERVEALAAWDYTRGGRSASGHQIVIGVIEIDGFALDHPDLAGQYYINPDEIPGNGIDDDNNRLVDDVTGWNFGGFTADFVPDSHAARVTGILAGKTNNGLQTAGLNAEARVLPLQISGYEEWILALDYLTDLRQRFNVSQGTDGAYVVVTNCSFGAKGDCRSADWIEINNAIDRAGQAGILTVGAAGNEGGDADQLLDVPTSCTSEHLVVVTASNKLDEVLLNVGVSPTQVDLAAPGEELVVIDWELFGRITNTFTGTSGSTPMVSGAVALLYSADCDALEARSLTAPAATALELKSILLNNVDLLPAFAGKTVSGGRLNIRQAMEGLIRSGGCVAPRAIVQFSKNAIAPERIDYGFGNMLELVDTLSLDWGMYRYTYSNWTEELPVALANRSGVIGWEYDYGLIATSRNFDLDSNQLGARTQSNELSFARRRVEVAREVCEDVPSVLARFDLAAFEPSGNELAGLVINVLDPVNGLDDDANGFVDDYSKTILDATLSNNAPGYGLQAHASLAFGNQDCEGISEQDGALRKTWQLQGHSYGDWLKAADLVYRQTLAQYQPSAGQSAMPVTVFATALEGLRPELATMNTSENRFSNMAARHLDSVGVLTILGSERFASTDRSLAASTPLALIVRAETAVVDIPGLTEIRSPSEAELACVEGTPIVSFSGVAVGVAQVAALGASFRAVQCGGMPSNVQQASALSAKLRAALSTSLISRNLDRLIDAQPELSAILYFQSETPGGRACELVTLAPNPIPHGQMGYVSVLTANDAVCPMEIVDLSGRVLYRTASEPGLGVGQLDLDSSVLPAGLYLLKLGIGKETQSHPFVVLH